MFFRLLSGCECGYISSLSSHLHQEEGHSVRLQGPGELHILHFCLDLCHLATVFMLLDRE